MVFFNDKYYFILNPGLQRRLSYSRYLNYRIKNKKLITPHTAVCKNDSECAICLNDTIKDKDIIKKLYCNHTFHKKCINKWLKINNTCPFCRTYIF